ncbi:MAG: hypothetical protein H3C47_05775 [Candidatus Cloacimonetes bacterium]|nr:hypothetical protein [Candidatus Cloacimonadota bacterium]
MFKSFLRASLNFVLPGLAQFLAGQRSKALVVFLCVTFCFFFGLFLDLDYYYRYQDIRRQNFTIEVRTDSKVQRLSHETRTIHPLMDPPIVFDFLPPVHAETEIVLSGSTKPLLALEVVNKSNSQRIQTQADYKGRFVFPPLPMLPGPNDLIYGAANDWLIPATGQSVHIADYDTAGRYQPSKLEQLWHFLYKLVFPLLLTPIYFLLGASMQAATSGWWDLYPLVKGEAMLPASIKDVGFYLIVMASMMNLIAWFDGFDTSYNKEVIDDLP